MGSGLRDFDGVGGVVVADGCLELEGEEVAVGDGERIGGVEEFGDVGEGEHTLQHLRYLLFGGGAVACYGLFDARGGVFCDGHAVGEGGSHANSLRTSEFEHCLYVFAAERGLDGEFVGFELVDDDVYAVEDAFETRVVVGDACHLDGAEDDDGGVVAFDVEEGVSHDVSTRVDAEDSTFRHGR